MGLLDEAIREHLELKRRRGADPSQIARWEQEALGPLRREPFRPADTEPAGEELHDVVAGSEFGDAQHQPEYQEYYEQEYYAEENSEDWGSLDEGGEPRRSSRRWSETPSKAASDPANDLPLRQHTEAGGGRWRHARRPSARSADTPSAEHDDLADGEETVEYSVDDAVTEGHRSDTGEKPGQPSGENESDMLEETPEFLQDAPEHDRLWFEQRPPRDFDFDD
jgi:hypothetical protein